jgi:hypothetical protein
VVLVVGSEILRQATNPPPQTPEPTTSHHGADVDPSRSTSHDRLQKREAVQCGLGREWDESEYGFIGTWTRIGKTNRFNARWVKGNQVAQGTLEIEMNGQGVKARRYHDNGGRCDYEGTVQDDMRTVKGTYHCNWSPEIPQWTAVIKCE